MEDDPFDFESDILLATSPAVAPKRRKKVIGLDDLLVDHYKEKNRAIERESKLAKTKKIYYSDDEEDGRVAQLSKYVDECHEKMTQLSDEDDVSNWGLPVFGNQKTLPSYVFNDLQSCSLFNTCVSHELNSLVELNTESGETFFEGLLTDGWLLTLVCKYGKVEKSIGKWTFHLMLYSSKEVLRNAAVDFWCAILSMKKEAIKIDWVPGYSELKNALENYGFLMSSSIKDSPNPEIVLEDSECMGLGPPQNIRGWIKYVTACSKARNRHIILSTREAEELVVIIICFLLDRQLLAISEVLNECIHFLVNSFENKDWNCTYTKIAISRASQDINSLRAVECIPAVCGPTQRLRSEIAFQILVGYFDKVENEEGVIRQLSLINLKDKSCDLFKVYIYLVLAENWFLYNPLLKEKELLNEMWALFLRNCCCQINITDTRSYAAKVRSKASYILQGTNDILV